LQWIFFHIQPDRHQLRHTHTQKHKWLITEE
jgi:hypothetical protein